MISNIFHYYIMIFLRDLRVFVVKKIKVDNLALKVENRYNLSNNLKR
jgi:hypothetical protein